MTQSYPIAHCRTLVLAKALRRNIAVGSSAGAKLAVEVVVVLVVPTMAAPHRKMMAAAGHCRIPRMAPVAAVVDWWCWWSSLSFFCIGNWSYSYCHEDSTSLEEALEPILAQISLSTAGRMPSPVPLPYEYQPLGTSGTNSDPLEGQP